VLSELNNLNSIDRINITHLRSAEFAGKAGVEELASQTINLLNAREAKASVYPDQIAFNLLATDADPRFAADLNLFLGNNSYSLMQQSINVPVFHGFMAAVQLRFTAEVDFDGAKQRLAGLDKVILKSDLASPISDCNQSFSCVISQLEQAPNQPSSLQFWLIADPMRYGLANNYVNVTDFLLKSFL